MSTIVPTVDGGSMLLGCLNSLAEQTYAAIEVILVDNGSKDGSCSEASGRYSGTRLVTNESNLGYATACNQGASIAQGDFLLFLNNDIHLAPHVLASLVEIYQGLPEGSILQPLTVFPSGDVDSAGDLFNVSGFLTHLVQRPSGSRPVPVFSVRGACMLISRRAFTDLGGYRNSYFAYFEETDLCWRVRLNSGEVFITPSVEVIHLGGATTRKVLSPSQIYYLSFRNRIRTIIANAGPLLLLRMLPLHVAGCLAVGAAFAIRGHVGVALSILRATLWPLVNIADWKQQRKLVQNSRSVNDKGLLRKELTAPLTIRGSLALLRGALTRWTKGPGSG